MRPLLCLLLLCSVPAFAQEEPMDDEPSGDDAPSMMRPGSDSPESQHARKYAGPRHRAQAFLIPMDEGARTPTTRVATAVETVLLRTPIYEVVDLGHALSVESTVEQARIADEGRRLVAEGNAAAAAKAWPEAAARYQRALQDFDQGLPAVGAHEYADATLRLGAADWMSGDEKAAKDNFALVARLDPRHKLDARAVEPAIEIPVAAARVQAEAARRGLLDVDTRPASARVQVDGESKGQTPVHAELSAGPHLLVVERAGFYPTAEIIDIAPRKPSRQSITLSATPTAASLSQIIAGASDEVGRGTAGKNVSALAEKFSLERVLIGSVRSQEEARVSVVLSLVDAPNHKVIASKTLTLVADGTDADQIELDTQNAARELISADDGAAKATADVPALVARERKVAMPAAAESKADAPAPVAKEALKKKQVVEKKKARGLEGKSGTEEWGDD
jgi:hypothetical protein